MPKELICKEIEENLKFVIYNIYPGYVQIHTDKGHGFAPDIPRTYYTYFTISRLWKHNLGNIKQKFEESFWKKKLAELPSSVTELDLVFICLYGMRACTNFGFMEYVEKYVTKFKTLEIKHVYHSAISMYVFMSAYNEVEELRKDEFMESVYNNCLRALEFMLNRKNVTNPLFYFSEFSYFPDKIPEYLYKNVKNHLKENFTKEYLKLNLTSSGVAKTLEHFGNVGDMEGFSLGLDFLEQRKYKKLNGFKNTFLPDYEDIFTEYGDSMYVMLDTNLHLLNAYFNIYIRT